MIVVTSRIRVTSGNANLLADLYRSRGRVADAQPGCLGVEILRHLDRPDEFTVLTRWTDRAAYECYRAPPSFREAHARVREVPGGIRIDRAERSVDWYEVLS